MKQALIVGAFMLAASHAVAGEAPFMAVEGAYARVAGAGANTAVYFMLHNNGKADDTLTGVHSVVAASVSLHESKMTGTMMSMAALGDVAVPAGGMVEFKPGGKHVMLVGLKEQLKVGGHFDIILDFKNAGPKTVPVEVRDIGAPAMDMSHTH